MMEVDSALVVNPDPIMEAVLVNVVDVDVAEARVMKT